MSDDKRQDAIDAGNRAKLLLEDPDLQSAFEDVRQALRDDWERSPANEPEKRERYYYALRGMNLAWDALRIRLDNGKIAASEIEEQD